MVEIIMGLAAVIGLVMMVAVVAGVVLSVNNSSSQRNVREYRRPSPGPDAREYHQATAPELAPPPCPAHLCTAAREQALTGWHIARQQEAEDRREYIARHDDADEWNPLWNVPKETPEPEQPVEQPIAVPEWSVFTHRK